MKYIKQKFRERKGSEFISAIIVFLCLMALVIGTVSVFGQVSKIDDIKQIAQSMAREISLSGKVDSKIQSHLSDLEEMLNIDVDMTVEGEYIGGSNKLETESDFTVIIKYYSIYHTGLNNDERVGNYAAKAYGTVEEYHK